MCVKKLYGQTAWWVSLDTHHVTQAKCFFTTSGEAETHIFVSRFSPFLTFLEAEHVSTAFPHHFVLFHWHPDPIFDFRKLKLFVCLRHYSEIHIVEFAEEGCKQMKKNTFEYIFFLLQLYFLPPQKYGIRTTIQTIPLPHENQFYTSAAQCIWMLGTCLIHSRSSWQKTSKLWLQSNANNVMQLVESQIAIWFATICSVSIYFSK